jgi:hypothetical protein
MDRFWSKVNIKGSEECWDWIRAVGADGYGVCGFEGKIFRAHRLAFKLSNNLNPDKLHVLHKCDNRICCNPNHLFLGTNLENVRDKMNKGRHNNQKKTHCKNGHEFNEVNTYIVRKKNNRQERLCKSCKKERVKLNG